MPEQDLNPAAAKFISSLVKSLQILCNGQVEFCESIELVGHINVRVDHKYKFDYIVDEHVSKEGEDSATTFLSNSYHSSPPSRQPKKKSSTTDFDHDIMFSEIPHNIHEKTRPPKDVHEPLVKSNDFCSDDTLVSGEENCPNFSVDVSSPKRQGNQVNQMVVKLEGDDDSNDCMVLPASPGDFEPVGEVTCEGFPSIGPSASFEESHVNQMGRTRKRRQPPEQYAESDNGNMVQPNRYGRYSGVPPASCHQTAQLSPLVQSSSYQQKFPSNTNDSNLHCNVCNMKFESQESLQSHAVYCHNYNNSDGFDCKMCSTALTTQNDLDLHMKMVHRHVTCSHCGTWCPSVSALRGHIQREHKPKFVCSICNKTFHCKINFKGHMNMHSGIKPYACSMCGKSFAYQQSKFAHERICAV